MKKQYCINRILIHCMIILVVLCMNFTSTYNAQSNEFRPDMPSLPEGPVNLTVGEVGSFTTVTIDKDGDKVQYRFMWEKLIVSKWSNLIDSGMNLTQNHSWNNPGIYLVRGQARDQHGRFSDWSQPLRVIVKGGNNSSQNSTNGNEPPSKPDKPNGPETLSVNEVGEFTSRSIDPDGDKIQYRFDWDANGNNEYSNWTSFTINGKRISLTHSWNNSGIYGIQVQARDENNSNSPWSEIYHVSIIELGNDPPHIPNNPNPQNNAISIPRTVRLTRNSAFFT